MAKATVKAEIKGEFLTIDVDRGNGATMGVDVRMPADAKTIDAACKVLMMNLAGISESELFVAGTSALIEAGTD